MSAKASRREIEGRGAALNRQLQSAQRALAQAQDRGLPEGVAANQSRIESLSDRIAALRESWFAANETEKQLQSELSQLGADPQATPDAAVERIAAADAGKTRSWRNDPISRAQVAKLEKLSVATVGFVVDTTITKGEASDLIAAIISGNIPQAQIPVPEQPAPAIVPTAATEVVEQAPATGGEFEVEGWLRTALAERTEEADLLAGSNDLRRYMVWAAPEFKARALAELTDLVTDPGTDPAAVRAAQQLLREPGRWEEVAANAAETYWETANPDAPETGPTTQLADAILVARANEERDAAESYLESAQYAGTAENASEPATIADSKAVQDALDLAVIPEIVDWEARARSLYDPAKPLDLPDLDADPALAAAMREVKGRARQALREDWWRGATGARADALDADRVVLIQQAIATPDVLATVEGRTASDLVAHWPFSTAIREFYADQAENAESVTRRAAAALATQDLRPVQRELEAAAADTWGRAHADDLGWDTATQTEWSQRMREHLEQNPIMGGRGTWLGGRDAALSEPALQTALEEVERAHPDLVAAIGNVPASRLAAEARRTILPGLIGPQTFTAEGASVRWAEKPSRRIASNARDWSYSTGPTGGISTGRDYRPALGYLLAELGEPIPEWVARIYEPFAEARTQVIEHAMLLQRGSAVYGTVAATEQLRDQSVHNSIATAYLEEGRRQVLRDLEVALPEQVATLHAAQLDLDWVLRSEVEPALIEELRTRPTDDLPRHHDVTVSGHRGIEVGEPDGPRVRIVNRNWQPHPLDLEIDGQRYAGVDTWADAIEQARSMLVAQRLAGAGRAPEVTATAEVAPEPAPAPEPEPAPEPSAVPVPDTEMGESITHPMWRTGELVWGVKPDGTRVRITPEKAARYAPLDVDPDVFPTRTSTPEPVTDRPALDVDPDVFPTRTSTPEPVTDRPALDVDPDVFPTRTSTPEPVTDSPLDLEAGVATPQVSTPEPVTDSPLDLEAGVANQYVEPVPFQLGEDVLVPASPKARVHANIAAVRLVKELAEAQRAATPAEQEVLAKWGGWGATPEVFDLRPAHKKKWAAERAELRELLGDEGLAKASATTLNAHYTDPAVVAEMWRAVERAGLPADALMLEPGCGSGHFVGTAPDGVRMVGVELEEISAQIAHYLYPDQQIRWHGFEREFAPNGAVDGAIGNVPFGDIRLYDPLHNAGSHTMHNHFIVKSLALTAPGGYVAVVTSSFTADALRTGARQEMAGLGDLVGAVRLPTGAFDRQAKTDVVTDVLVFRRREEGREPTADTTLWAGPVKDVPALSQKSGEDVEHPINAYYAKYPQRVLGRIEVGHGAHGRTSLIVQPRKHLPLTEQLRHQLDPLIDAAVESGLGFTQTEASRPAGLRAPGLHLAPQTDATTIPPGVMQYDERRDEFRQLQVGKGWTVAPCRGQARKVEWRAMIALGQTLSQLTEAARSPDSTVEERDELRRQLNTQYDAYVAQYGPLNRFKLSEPAPLTEEKIAERISKLEAAERINLGKQEARDAGRPLSEAEPYTGHLAEDTWELIQEKANEPNKPRKIRAHFEGAIARDPLVGLAMSLELFASDYDGTNATAQKSSVFDVDVSPVKELAASAETVEEAMAISFDELGYLSLYRIADLLDVAPGDAADWARGLMYPSLEKDGEWEIAATFLSGNVRGKLEKARQLASEDPDLHQGSVAALEAAVPADADPARIGVRPGAVWVPMSYYKQFLVEEFGLNPDRLSVDFTPQTGNWNFKTTEYSRHQSRNGYTDRYGSARLTGVEMFDLIANNKAIQVSKTPDELERAPKPRFHEEATSAARATAAQLQKRFSEWLWADGDRYVDLTARYNERLNSFVKPDHRAEHKKYPGLNPKYVPYDYQANAVQRFLHDETILLDHVVGAGKTLTMTIACMEAKRLGQVQQPWIVVPNHLLGQWGEEARDAYPGAKILVASELSDVADRQRFIGQTAVGDWDMVIVPQSVFGLIGMKREAQIEYLDNEMAELREGLQAANEQGQNFSVKQIERTLKKSEERMQALIAQKATDSGFTFEQSGCDFLFVDEAHDYKNLARASNSEDLAVQEGAQRASDLEMKARYLRKGAADRNAAEGRPHAPAKALAFATGTPISNSMSEIWVMMKFLRPDLLAKAGMNRIDNWAGVFAEPTTVPEMNITGSRLRMRSRMANYANIPELVAMLNQFRDVVVANQIPVDLPVLEGGAPTVIEFDMSQSTIDFMADLDERMENIDPTRMDLDNSLKIANDGRNVTMFPSLGNLPTPDPENSRIEHAADLLWKCAEENKTMFTPRDKYGPDVEGVFQLVFADRGTPKAGQSKKARNVYTDLRAALIERGMAPEVIAFMHDYNTPKKKAELMKACRDGRVRVLITSTKKGGTGMNVQRILKQMINLDPAWTASDMEQRIGRIVRQGNVNKIVSIINMVARRSFDAMMYQYVERKGAFTAQLRSEDLPPTMEDVGGDLTATWAQTKAAATGDPVFVEQVAAKQTVTMLEAQRTAVDNANKARAATIAGLGRQIGQMQTELPVMQKTAAQLAEWSGIEDRDQKMWGFMMGDVADGNPADLVDAMQHSISEAAAIVTGDRRDMPFVTVGGVPVVLSYSNVIASYTVSVAGAERYYDRDKMIDIMGSDNATQGFITQLRNHVTGVIGLPVSLESRLHENRKRLAEAEAEPVEVFEHDEELDQARMISEELTLEVNARENSPEALEAAEESLHRRRSEGQYTGWTLDLNPTPAMVEESGRTRNEMIAGVPLKMRQAQAAWIEGTAGREKVAHAQPWQPVDSKKAEWTFGFEKNSGMPGAEVRWHGRQWKWEAWDGQGTTKRGGTAERGAAFGEGRGQALKLAEEVKVSGQSLHDASVERGAARREAEAPSALIEPTEIVEIRPTDPEVEAEGEATVDPAILDGLRAAGSSQHHSIGDMLNNSEATESEPDPGATHESGPEVEPDAERGHGL